VRQERGVWLKEGLSLATKVRLADNLVESFAAMCDATDINQVAVTDLDPFRRGRARE